MRCGLSVTLSNREPFRRLFSKEKQVNLADEIISMKTSKCYVGFFFFP